MWIIRKDGAAFNLDRAEMLRTNDGITEVLINKTWWVVSSKDVTSYVMENLGNHKITVEVE